MNSQLTDPQAPVTDEELDQMIWKLERDGMTPKMLSLMRELRELREWRKAVAEPVADVVAWSSPNEERTCDIRWRRFDVAPGPLYAAPPAQVKYNIGDATMRHIFTPTCMTDVSDMQAVFDRVETVLAKSEPVAWRWFHLNQWHVTNDEDRARDLAWDGVKVMPLYTSPPALVVPDEMAISDDMNLYQKSFAQGHNACRATMINNS